MIIKGNPAGNVGFWSKHLLRDDTNERAEVKEISGLLAEDLPTALREMQADSRAEPQPRKFHVSGQHQPARRRAVDAGAMERGR